jgi:hypothetical protein
MKIDRKTAVKTGLGVGVATFIAIALLSGQSTPDNGSSRGVVAIRTGTPSAGESPQWDGVQWQSRPVYVTSDPDGVKTALLGTTAYDTSTGVTWKNMDGATRWDPISVPGRYGFFLEGDWVGVNALNQGAAGGGAFTQPASGR